MLIQHILHSVTLMQVELEGMPTCCSTVVKSTNTCKIVHDMDKLQKLTVFCVLTCINDDIDEVHTLGEGVS